MSKKQHELFEISQKIILYNPQDKKFLIVKDENGTEFTEKYGAWELPGGRIDKGESVEQTISRELIEELGNDVEYEIRNSVHGYVMNLTKQPSRALLTTLAIYKGGEIKLSEEHAEYRWNTLEEVGVSEEYGSWLKEAIRNASTHLKSEELLGDVKRVQADFENYKKRQMESQKELRGYLIEKLVLDIVPVLDNFRSATLHVPAEEKDSPWVIGIQYIEKQLETVLTDNGVQTIEVKEGEEFDPQIHEAVSKDPTPASPPQKATDEQSQATEGQETESSHTIAKVIQKGYKFGDRVIRPAKVIVK